MKRQIELKVTYTIDDAGINQYEKVESLESEVRSAIYDAIEASAIDLYIEVSDTSVETIE